ncbi:glutathione S-transferase family protein [Austwickia chelonae]|uniref:glutathione S-transferase family protein n=1 Tax=Austwickia chelonae TaxID=100225 RepID=UPI000E26EA88|nr:glutathione S-transferase C-terminal domain-containing protein [Austwickia chelonae]
MNSNTDQKGSYVTQGKAFDRDTNYITTCITVDGSEGYLVEPDRYRLVVSRACPWANRAMIARRVYGLESVISLGVTGPTHDKRSWTFDLDPEGKDPVLGIHFLKDAYEKRYPGYPRGITVPALVDTRTGAVVTNDYAQMTLDMGSQWRSYHREGAPDLYPVHLREEMDELMVFIFRSVNNGVYRCGFAGSQASYDRAYDELWYALDTLEKRLSTRRYLMGASITEADLRLYPTLVRFDEVYYAHFKCNRQPLATMPQLWGYTRDLFQTPGFGDTNDFVHMKEHYYGVHTDINPTQIVPRGPRHEGWLETHGRDHLDTETWGAEGTPPPPVLAAEKVDEAHTPLRTTASS